MATCGTALASVFPARTAGLRPGTLAAPLSAVPSVLRSLFAEREPNAYLLSEYANEGKMPDQTMSQCAQNLGLKY